MEIKIGIQHAPRELTVETEVSASDVEEQLAAALTTGGLFTLADPKGRKILIPAARIAYLDLGQEHSRPVGFGAV